MSSSYTSDKGRWARIESILDRVLEIEDPSQQAELVEELCADEPALCQEVEGLLGGINRGPDLLDQPLAAATPDLVAGFEDEIRQASGGDRAGRTIDRYRLIEVLGRGGMGVVYLAERADKQFEKRVALKLLPRGLESPEKERRFLNERQILARLEHPGIARLLDGGVTDEGYPYLVMEHVEGTPIDRYCEDHGLTVRERVQLVIHVSRAVHFAHQNLIVHRDLKPGNIFVTADGETKLLDFGVGKILEGSESNQATVFQPMTLGYASPEQLLNRPVSTASDVYSLGVLLYRVLTGVLPIDCAGLTPSEIERIVQEGSFPPPSLASDGEHQSSTVERKRQNPQLEGDLDTIILKALRFEPDRRYGSALELAEDLQRHLDGLPIDAHPSTFGYRAKKFVARNGLAVTAALVVGVLLILGVIGIAWQGRVAAEERDRAQLEAQRAEQVSTFLVGLFDAANPQTDSAGQLSARDLLDQGESRIRTELDTDPQTRGSILAVMSEAYSSLGDFERAESLALAAINDLRSSLGNQPLPMSRALIALGRSRLERGAYDAALPPLEESLRTLRQGGEMRSREAAMSHRYLGFTQERSISSDMGASHHKTAIEIWRELGLEGELAKEIHFLAGSLDAMGRTDEGLETKREALAKLTAYYGNFHPYVASISNDIAYSLHRAGDNDAAEPLYRRSIEIQTQIVGADHIEVAQSLTNLGRLMMDDGRFAEAEPFVRRAVEIMQMKVAETNFERIGGEVNLASLYVELDRLEEAIPLYRSALRRFEDLVGPDDIPSVRVESLLARALHRQGNLGESERLYRHAISQQRPKSPRIVLGDSLVGLGAVLTDGNRATEALPIIEEGLKIHLEALPAGDWRLAQSKIELARALADLERFDEASAQLETGVALLEQADVVDPWLERRSAALARRFEAGENI